jgi:large subunit ribosomal protein L9
MKVILRKCVDGLGDAGKIAQVSDGYARNYLLPRKLAYPATEGNVKRAQEETKKIAQEVEKRQEEDRRLCDRLQGISVTLAAHAAEEGKLFGSVTAQGIAEALVAQGYEVDKRHVELDSPIKELGVFPVRIRFSQEVCAEIRVWVVKE